MSNSSTENFKDFVGVL